MKKTIICLVLLCALLLPACQSGKAPSKSSVSDQLSAPTSSSTTEPSEGSLSDSTTPGEPIDFRAMRQQIYDEMFALVKISQTDDFHNELYRLYKEKYNKEPNYSVAPVLRIDPFADTLVAPDDISKVSVGMLFGEVRSLFGKPVCGRYWIKDPTPGGGIDINTSYYGH